MLSTVIYLRCVEADLSAAQTVWRGMVLIFLPGLETHGTNSEFILEPVLHKNVALKQFYIQQ